MKIKTFRRFLSILILAFVMVAAPVAGAKNVKNITLKVGQKKTVTYKTGKKVRYSSDKKKIATVSKKGIITAKKKGTATVTVKYKKKKIIYKVKVKAKSRPLVTKKDKKENKILAKNISLAKNLTVTGVVTLQNNVIIVVKNENSKPVASYKINYKLKTSEGKELKSDIINGNAINPGETQYKVVNCGPGVGAVDISKSYVNVEADSQAKGVSIADKINVNSKMKEQGVEVTVTNNYSGGNSITGVVILFYDRYGKLADAVEETFDLPYGKTETKIIGDGGLSYSTYKIFYSSGS